MVNSTSLSFIISSNLSLLVSSISTSIITSITVIYCHAHLLTPPLYRLALTSQSISELRLGIDEVPPWVNLLVQCRLTGINPNGKHVLIYYSLSSPSSLLSLSILEPERVFATSLACSKLLFNTSTISSGITAGHILASLATLMYSPVTISEVNEGERRVLCSTFFLNVLHYVHINS